MLWLTGHGPAWKSPSGWNRGNEGIATAYTNVQTISTLRTGNNWKATLVGWGIGFQLSAILVLIGRLAWELRAFA